MFFLVDCNLPPVITGILAQVYKIILIAVPIGIVLFGSIDFVKAIVSKDQDTISKSTKTFITRIITGALTFFVLTIVTWLFRVIIGNVQDSSSALDCALQILGGNSSYTPSSGGSSGTINLGPTLDKVTNSNSCISSCTGYYQSNSCIQACQTYCGSGHLVFNANDNPCNLPSNNTTNNNSSSNNQKPVTTTRPSGGTSSGNSSSTCISNCSNNATYNAGNEFAKCWESADTSTCLNVQTSAYNSSYNACINNC